MCPERLLGVPVSQAVGWYDATERHTGFAKTIVSLAVNFAVPSTVGADLMGRCRIDPEDLRLR